MIGWSTLTPEVLSRTTHSHPVMIQLEKTNFGKVLFGYCRAAATALSRRVQHPQSGLIPCKTRISDTFSSRIKPLLSLSPLSTNPHNTFIMPVKSNNGTAANKFARAGYNTIVKRNSIFLTTIFVSAFAAEMVFDSVSDRIWDNLNKGVRLSYGYSLFLFSSPLSTWPSSLLFSLLLLIRTLQQLYQNWSRRRHGKFGLFVLTEDSGTGRTSNCTAALANLSLDRTL